MAELDFRSHLLSDVVRYMKRAGTFQGLSGADKKEMVITMILNEIELPEILEDLVSEIIDLIIDVENKKLIINPKVAKVSNSLFSVCCGSRK